MRLPAAFRLQPPKSGFRRASKPHILHRPAVTWKFFEAVVPLEVPDRKVADRRRLRQPDIYRSQRAPVLVLGIRNKMRHTPAESAEVEADISAVATPISACLPGRLNITANVPIGPQGAVTPADCAIAGRDRLWHRIKSPVNFAAVARSLQHTPISALDTDGDLSHARTGDVDAAGSNRTLAPG